jgi:hypothetical protein
MDDYAADFVTGPQPRVYSIARLNATLCLGRRSGEVCAQRGLGVLRWIEASACKPASLLHSRQGTQCIGRAVTGLGTFGTPRILDGRRSQPLCSSRDGWNHRFVVCWQVGLEEGRRGLAGCRRRSAPKTWPRTVTRLSRAVFLSGVTSRWCSWLPQASPEKGGRVRTSTLCLGDEFRVRGDVWQ